MAKGIRSIYPIYIAEISPGRAVSRSMRYYHWDTLVRELDATIKLKATNRHEYVFLGHIPLEAITWYGTVEESERHCFEDEDDDEDYGIEQDEEEQEGDSPFLTIPLSIRSYINEKFLDSLLDSELLDSPLISMTELQPGRADGQDPEEGKEEVEEAELESEEQTEYLFGYEEDDEDEEDNQLEEDLFSFFLS